MASLFIGYNYMKTLHSFPSSQMNYSKKKNVKKKIFTENTDEHALNNHKETTIQSQ